MHAPVHALVNALPIDEALPALQRALAASSCAVLEAPPGAGKTTRVPLALLEAPWLDGKRVVMLEPRRLAARAAATYMAALLGERVGERVGYRIRGDTRVSRATRIEVVTEGVLARLLAADPALEEYGAVLFDEFHERSLHADLGLALTLETQAQLRETLRVLVMSATLDGDGVAALLGGAAGAAPIVRSAGRQFPIETHYRPPRRDEYLDATVARAVREAIDAHDGDVLVFLPGAAEQRRVGSRLHGDPTLARHRVAVHTLHGSMPIAAQDAALAPAPAGTRKVVLATSVAETSLTIEGVRVVVDGGLSRVPRYDARAGLTRLDTVRVSRASADQRRGRAGRVAPGVCYRLWDPHEEHGFLARTRPEILEADLAPLALELADAGIHDPGVLRWLDVPRAGPFAAARELLRELEALDARGRITPHGKRMAALPLQPRLAHMTLRAAERGEQRLGAQLAALLEERDLLRGDRDASSSDMRLRVEALRSPGKHGSHRDDAARVATIAREVEGRLRSARADHHAGADDLADTGALLALAFPDRVAARRAGSEPRYLLRNGAGALLPKHDALADAPYLAVAELDGAPPDYRIARCAPLEEREVRALFAEAIETREEIAWHAPSRSVRATRRAMLGAIALDERSANDADPAEIARVFLQAVRDEGIAALPWSDGASALRRRLAFLHRHDGRFPDVSDTALADTLDAWLAPRIDGMRKWSDLSRVDFADALRAGLPWELRSALDRLAPVTIEVPSGSSITLDYTDPEAPVLPVKLQEVFGWSDTPRIMDGRVPLTLHLLSPARRPVQVTRDLAGFWRGSYFEVRKELRGRYPKHPWPEDPLSAEATRFTKRRS